MFMKYNLALTVPRGNAHPSVFKFSFFYQNIKQKHLAPKKKNMADKFREVSLATEFGTYALDHLF